MSIEMGPSHYPPEYMFKEYMIQPCEVGFAKEWIERAEKHYLDPQKLNLNLIFTKTGEPI